MDTKQQIADRIKKANNILVTVSANPSVDQLAACIGLTLVCNKLGKHATAVFSGAVPPIIEFLEPEKTIEKNTDSLRDFIIALDKSKAYKLRYKVEDKVVKIFITPYRTSISEKDLDFSQGDFNVDVIVAIGVHSQADLDQAITAHGRILHDAAVVTLNVAPGGELGGMNWLEPGASSLSELAAELAETVDKKLMDGQIATAFLTGIVAETERFSNARTSPQTMSISAELMSLGANQQLVASKLEAPAPKPASVAPPTTQPEPQKEEKPNNDGTLEIQHIEEAPTSPEPEEASTEPEPPQIHIDEHGEIRNPVEPITPEAAARPEDSGKPAWSDTLPSPQHIEGPKLILEPPTFASELTANAGTAADEERPSGSPLTLPTAEPPTPLLQRTPLAPASMTPPSESAPATPPISRDEPPVGPTILPPTPEPAVASPQSTAAEPPAANQSTETLAQIEQDVHSPHVDAVSQQPTLPSPVDPFTQPAPASVQTPPAPFTPPPSFAMTPPVPTPAPPVEPWTPTPALTTAQPMVSPSVDAAAPTTVAADNPDSPALPTVDTARDAVAQAINQGTPPAEPIQALNAQILGAPLHDDNPAPVVSTSQPYESAPPPVPPPIVPPAQQS